MLLALARRDFRARYRSARLGLAWAVAVPMLQGLVFALIFTRIVRVESPDDFPTYVYSGVVVYTAWSAGLSAGSTAVADAAAMTTRVYFPRVLLGPVPVLAAVPALAVSLALVAGFAAVRGVPASPRWLLLPVVGALVVVLTALAVAVTSAMHVYLRDVRYLVQAVLMVSIYATPVLYPLALADGLIPLVLANPPTGPIQVSRWVVFGHADHLGVSVIASCAWIVVLALLTVTIYARTDRILADRL